MDDLERLEHGLDSGALALPDGPVLVLNAKPGPALERLGPERLRGEQGSRPLHDALLGRGLAVAPRMDGEDFAAAILLMPRNRAEALGALARAFRLTHPDGLVVVSGSKTDGIDAAIARLRRLLPAESLAKGHGKLAWATRPAILPEVLAAWESEAAPARNAEGFLTAPGMFSHGHGDPGSRQLADALAGRLSGRVAELGAGYGWLAASLLASNPDIAEMTLVEADHAACEAARTNVADARATVVWADATTLPRGPFDHVVTNPPFHAGRAAEPALGQAFIAAAARILGPKGQLALVANRQLPYEAALERHFVEWRQERAGGGYKVLLASRPRGLRATARRNR